MPAKMRQTGVYRNGDEHMIAIIMAVYNGETYLNEQIDSLLSNTEKDFVLHIFDDGSTDRSAAVIQSYTDKYPSKIFYHRNVTNQGVIHNFLNGCLQVDADYYMFCDQDDVWLPEKIAHSVEAVKLAEAQSPNVPIALFGDARVVDDSLQQLHPSFQQMSGYHTDALDVAHLLMENKLIGCTMLFNRALRDKLTDTVPDGLRMHDWWIALIASAFGRIIYLDETLLLYRQHTGNVVGGSSRSHYITNRVKHLTAQRQVLYDTCKQAEVFLTIYNDQLTETQKRLVSLFAGLPSANWFTRRYLILRYHFLKSGLLRNLGVLLII